jgi:hypothetical protein
VRNIGATSGCSLADPDGNECECISRDPDHTDATKTGYESELIQRES